MSLVLALAACADGSGPDRASAHTLDVPLPAALQGRAVDRERLEVEVTVTGADVEPMREGETWSASTTVAPGHGVPAEIAWFELLGLEIGRPFGIELQLDEDLADD